ncbi:MAG: 4-hydroxythreonine-4-phosphate dehydrogenase PdxA [Phycisphaerales bacterium]
MAKRPTIAVTLGDPGGIGPEVIAKSLADAARRTRARWRIHGTKAAVHAACASAGIDPSWLDEIQFVSSGFDDRDFARSPNARGGSASFAWVNKAVDEALSPKEDPARVDAVVTGPISKTAWALAGHTRFPGHTELLADRCGTSRFAMMFRAPTSEAALTPRPGLHVILATVHIPLRAVASALSKESILQTIELGDVTMRRFGYQPPRIAVCGLNPHAGEHGLLGTEDESIILPAVRAAQAKGIDAHGPFPADTVFSRALEYPRRRAEFDLVVAMYHDQGLIPLKTLAWDRAVNMTVGLPFIRTSPDHGTAFDIAGSNIANAGSMAAAMDAAIELATPQLIG